MAGGSIMVWFVISANSPIMASVPESDWGRGGVGMLRSCCENRAREQLGAELCVDKAGTSCLLCPLGWLQQGPWCYSVSDAFSSWEGSRANCTTRLLVPEGWEKQGGWAVRLAWPPRASWSGTNVMKPTTGSDSASRAQPETSWVGDPGTRGIRLRMTPGPPQEQCGAFRDKQSIYPDLSQAASLDLPAPSLGPGLTSSPPASQPHLGCMKLWALGRLCWP
ncbi:hypothetical protein Y1Q_0023933 [Alligator mississippiensis]|uniref:Uncharacterized protein n=1 Tax=Alligator mississippiensis TaxID=8496 RepID=A0A151NTJ9_ALLMI|nr:hypothetical protein Y1Q_0023933 [Alligator mississippiensis]